MRTAITAIIVSLTLSGCATTYAPPQGRLDYGQARRAFEPTPAPQTLDENAAQLCQSYQNMAYGIAEARSKGISKEQAKQLLALISVRDTTTSWEIKKMVGAGSYMVADKIYSGVSPATIKSTCMSENWPMMLFLAVKSQ